VRTTVTLDDDLAIRLERRRADRHASLKDTLNEAIRVGLAALDAGALTSSAASVTRPLPLGRRRIESVDNVAEALAIAEGESYR
jgi:hypothetical protein